MVSYAGLCTKVQVSRRGGKDWQEVATKKPANLTRRAFFCTGSYPTFLAISAAWSRSTLR